MTTAIPPAVDDLVARNRARLERAAEIQRRLERAQPPFNKDTVLEPLNELMLELADVSELAGLPADYVQAHQPGPDGKIHVTTNYPDLIPFQAYAKSGRARRQLSFVNLNRCVPRNLELLKQMLAKRHQLAGLLG